MPALNVNRVHAAPSLAWAFVHIMRSNMKRWRMRYVSLRFLATNHTAAELKNALRRIARMAYTGIHLSRTQNFSSRFGPLVISLKNPLGEGVGAVLDAIDDLVAEGEATAGKATKDVKEAVDKTRDSVKETMAASKDKLNAASADIKSTVDAALEGAAAEVGAMKDSIKDLGDQIHMAAKDAAESAAAASKETQDAAAAASKDAQEAAEKEAAKAAAAVDEALEKAAKVAEEL